MNLPRPGCMVRSALIVFALLFLPMAILFAYRDLRHYWLESLVLIFVSIAFLRAGLDRRDESWLAAIDELSDSDRRK
ncbi:MAG TPA: hypothetical protein VN706_10765 [Gemmatimonadaceae bacterium]|nr:hypothetical protein [Gemmatimonadaceae bacterium]